jgi:hypothetical protein
MQRVLVPQLVQEYREKVFLNLKGRWSGTGRMENESENLAYLADLGRVARNGLP